MQLYKQNMQENAIDSIVDEHLSSLKSPAQWKSLIDGFSKTHSLHETCALLSTATSRIPVEEQVRDPDYFRLWIDLIRVKTKLKHGYDDISAIFKKLKLARVGTSTSKFYLAWAEFEVVSGFPDKAKQILTSAISLQVEPVNDLRDALKWLIASREYKDKENVANTDNINSKVASTGQTILQQRQSVTNGSINRSGLEKQRRPLSLKTEASTPVQQPISLLSKLEATTLHDSPEQEKSKLSNQTTGSGSKESSATRVLTGFGKLPRRLGTKLGPPLRAAKDDTMTLQMSIPSPPGSTASNSPDPGPLKTKSISLVKESLDTDNTPPPMSRLGVQEMFTTPSPDETMNTMTMDMDLTRMGSPTQPQFRPLQKKSDASETAPSEPIMPKRPDTLTMMPSRLGSLGSTTSNEDLKYQENPVMTPPLVPQRSNKTHFYIKGKTYQRIELIGRGGSSKVFKILCETTGQIYALKKVKLSGQDPTVAEGYLNEISLLQKLSSNERIIKLIDHEVVLNSHILMVLEYGEIDLAHLLQRQSSSASEISLHFIKNYWEQMLQAVQAIHEQNIIHSDLKPANFLLVEGQLKLIDFGIAKTIPNDTTNIHRDHQTGTVNYMAPEAITFVDTNAGGKEVKLGRASDVWSLGCILYQLVYGHPPFGHLNMVKKLSCIVNPSFQIPFPSVPAEKQELVRILEACLVRDPKRRVSISELLQANKKPMEQNALKEVLLFAVRNGLTEENVDDIVKLLSCHPRLGSFIF